MIINMKVDKKLSAFFIGKKKYEIEISTISKIIIVGNIIIAASLTNTAYTLTILLI